MRRSYLRLSLCSSLAAVRTYDSSAMLVNILHCFDDRYSLHPACDCDGHGGVLFYPTLARYLGIGAFRPIEQRTEIHHGGE
jgi:hypothetical protein